MEIVFTTLEKLGFSNGATAEEVLRRVQELGIRLVTAEEVQQMMDEGVELPESSETVFFLKHAKGGH